MGCCGAKEQNNKSLEFEQLKKGRKYVTKFFNQEGCFTNVLKYLDKTKRYQLNLLDKETYDIYLPNAFTYLYPNKLRVWIDFDKYDSIKKSIKTFT